MTVEQAQQWWRRWPHAGVAILTGRRSGIDVIDIDPKNGGSLEALAAKYPGVPTEPTVRTGSGGAHLYVNSPKVPTSNGLNKLIGLPGVDYRGDGGLAAAPPTVHRSGAAYEFITMPPAALTLFDWLDKLAGDHYETRRQRDENAAELARRFALAPVPPPSDGEATDTGRNMVKVALRKSSTRSRRPASLAGGTTPRGIKRSGWPDSSPPATSPKTSSAGRWSTTPQPLSTAKGGTRR